MIEYPIYIRRRLIKLKERCAKLKTDIPAIWLALKSKDTPVGAKIFAALTVAYGLSPIDLIPDFIPILGYLDDLLILPFLVLLTVKLIPAPLFERFRTEAADMWKNGKPNKWYFAIPVVVIWLLIIFVIINALFFH